MPYPLLMNIYAPGSDDKVVGGKRSIWPYLGRKRDHYDDGVVFRRQCITTSVVLELAWVSWVLSSASLSQRVKHIVQETIEFIVIAK